MKYKLAVLKGDGIGEEIINSAINVLNTIDSLRQNITVKYFDFGGIAYDKYGECFPENTLNGVLNSDAVLLGSVGGDKWNSLELKDRPEMALLKLRKELDAFCNIRPLKVYNSLKEKSPIKLKGKEVDFIIVRELTSGIYFGDKKSLNINGETVSTDQMMYSESEIRRVMYKAFNIAISRKKVLTLIDKANVLETSRLWRKVAKEVNKEFKDVKLECMYVDNAAMQIILNPDKFDVIVTSNMFGDIISDESAVLAGSIGLLPSASINEMGKGIYEPIHGSAPDIKGLNIANPIGTILSLAMLLRYSFKMDEEAELIEKAVEKTINDGVLTKDVNGKYGTKEITEYICKLL